MQIKPLDAQKERHKLWSACGQMDFHLSQTNFEKLAKISNCHMIKNEFGIYQKFIKNYIMKM